ncbi:MAG: hypothetical protein IMW89_21395 [Ktedonobacteraceae bacterium]|nr:hypothetical protein [Ktedonobacteraceae bacterium]
MRKKLLMILCGLALLATAFLVDGKSTSVSATPAQPQQAEAVTVSCFDQAGTFGPGDGFTLGPGVFRTGTGKTSAHCRDINVKLTKLTSPIQLQVCFTRFKPDKCNDWKTFDKNDVNKWRPIATNVLNGVEYQVGIKTFKKTTIKGLIAD